MNSKTRLEKLAYELHDEFRELVKNVHVTEVVEDAQIAGNNILHIFGMFDECVKELAILHLAAILLHEIAERRN